MACHNKSANVWNIRVINQAKKKLLQRQNFFSEEDILYNVFYIVGSKCCAYLLFSYTMFHFK